MGSIKGGGQQVAVVDYTMSMHYGVAISADALTGIYAQQKTVWEGDVEVNAIINVNNPALFGGPKAQGGMVGQVFAMFGRPDQIAPLALAKRLFLAGVGLTTDTCPAFRGLLTLLFCSEPGAGFHFQFNSPSIPPLSFKLRRAPVTPLLDPFYAYVPARGAAANRLVSAGFNENLVDPDTGLPIVITGTGPTYGPTIPDSNPAHIIYEILTNPDWGMGLDPAKINTTSFQNAATVLFSENFGLSYLWTSQDTIDTFVTQILGCIQAALYTRPSTGMFELKLFRPDYWVVTGTGSVFVGAGDINQHNATITSFSRKMPGELANEVVIDWTNPLTEQTESITVQDPGSIANQNGIISQRSTYPGVRNELLATELAMRDLRSVGAPLGVIEATVNRTLFDLVPGDVVTVTYPEYGLDGLICRIVKIDYGKPGDSAMKVNLLEDIFATGSPSYVVAPPPIWEDPKKDPQPVTLVLPLTLPMYMLLNLGDGGIAAGREFAEVAVGMLAAPPVQSSNAFELIGETVDSLGNATDTDLGTKPFQAHGVSTTALPREAATASFLIGPLVGYGAVPVGAFLVMVSDAAQTDRTMEIMVVSSYNSAADFALLERGLFDTIPQEWPAGTPFYLVNLPTRFDDPIGRAAGDTFDYKLLTIAAGMLNPALAPVVEFTPTQRPFLPNRPANINVGGSHFNPLDWATDDDIPVLWANRNRLTEESRIVLWTDGDLPVEDGQTTTIKVWPDDLSAPITTINDLTGTLYNLPVSAFDTATSGYVQVLAKRAGLESLQGFMIQVGLGGTSVDLIGYGYDYGNNYGGAGPGGGGGGGGGGDDWIVIPNDSVVTIGGLSWTALNADTGHSALHSASLGEYKFEVLDGERYQHPGLFVDPTYVMRSELNGPTFAFDIVATFTYGVMLTGVPSPTTNAWLIVGQIHADDHVSGASPIWSANILPDGSGGENVVFDVNYNTGSGPVFTTMGSMPFTRGVHYDFKVEVIDARGGDGYIRVTVNGAVVATWTGKTGYSTATIGGHPKFGIYTGGHGLVATDPPDLGQDIVAVYDNISFSAAAVVADAFYISPTGNDSNVGTKAAPFLSPTKANTAMAASGTRKTTYFMRDTHTISAWPFAAGTTWTRDPTVPESAVTLHTTAARLGATNVAGISVKGLHFTSTVTGPILGFYGCPGVKLQSLSATCTGPQGLLELYNYRDGTRVQGISGTFDTWNVLGGIFPVNIVVNDNSDSDDTIFSDFDIEGGTFGVQFQDQSATPGIATNQHVDRFNLHGWGDTSSTVGSAGLSYVGSPNPASHSNTCFGHTLTQKTGVAGGAIEAGTAGCTYAGSTFVSTYGFTISSAPNSLFDNNTMTVSVAGIGSEPSYDGVDVEIGTNEINGVSTVGSTGPFCFLSPAPTGSGLPTNTPSAVYVP